MILEKIHFVRIRNSRHVRRGSRLSSKSGLLRGFSHSGKPKSMKAISIPDPKLNDRATPADTRNHEIALSDQRMANLPVKAEWIRQASQPPTVRLANRKYF
jgi:hypothetical protein